MQPNPGRVVVLGSANMDIVTTTPRHPRIGETVSGRALEFYPGGKGANQAVASAKLGVPTVFVGRLGQDWFGETVERFLTDQGVVVQAPRLPRVRTGVGVIVVDDAGDNSIVVVPGANALVGVECVDEIDIESHDVLVAQYEIPLSTVEAFFARGKERGAATLLNAAPGRKTRPELLGLVDTLIVNETELALMAGPPEVDSADLLAVENAARGLLVGRDQRIVVTLGAEGALWVGARETGRVAGRNVEAVDTTGAGDCFVGALAGELALGAELPAALRTANLAASLSVQKPGAGPSMPDRAAVEAVL